jgi:hypothetical protein
MVTAEEGPGQGTLERGHVPSLALTVLANLVSCDDDRRRAGNAPYHQYDLSY